MENIQKGNSQAWLEASRLSLGGTSSVALDSYISRNKAIKRLILCLDNDKAGNATVNKIIERYSTQGFVITKISPHEKDFNDDLASYLKENKL